MERTAAVGDGGTEAVAVVTALGRSARATRSTAAVLPPQVLQVTVQPTRLSWCLSLCPDSKNPLPIPALTSSTADLLLATASYSRDGKDLLVFMINVDLRNPTSGGS